MLNYLKNLFTKDADPNLTKLKKLTNAKVNAYQALNELHATFLVLRLAELPAEEIAIALSTTVEQVKKLDDVVIKKLS